MILSVDASNALVRQDLDDLFERWEAAIAAVERSGSAADAKRSRVAFDALLDYIHAGAVPDVEGPDEVLVRVEKEARR